MPPSLVLSGATELSAALLQAVITAALAGLCAYLYERYGKPYFAWWAAAWTLYLLRVGAIVSFLTGSDRIWLYWHQVITGWTGLALLWAALVFSQRLRWRWGYVAFLLFPPLWSYVAIYRLDNFLWAAGPAVIFLGLATLWTGWVFLQYRRRVGSGGATLLATAFFLWGVHHFDYPFLRAQGAWNPWGYYLDILFELAVGAGIILLVLDDLRRGLDALSALSGDLQRGGREREVRAALLGRPLSLPSVRGTALYLLGEGPGAFVAGAGACADWTGAPPAGEPKAALDRAVASGLPQVTGGWADTADAHTGAFAYAAVLPIFRGPDVSGALVLVGDARDPFTALDDSFLLALGQQVGTALEHADLYERLEARTVELARLSARMLEQHEEERRRLSRELHDETAQVFSAVKMELGVLRESLAEGLQHRLDQTLALVDTGIRGIRNVVNDLRPSLLDDLGLLPALRSMVAQFIERSGIPVELQVPRALPALSKDAELALFRALQEALTNILRHAGATAAQVQLVREDDELALRITDDGRGLPADRSLEHMEMEGHMGLAGMRERLHALGGTVRVETGEAGGLRLEIRLPVPVASAA